LHKKVRVTMRAKQSEVETRRDRESVAIGMSTGIVISPFRGWLISSSNPRLYAVGCILSPLCGFLLRVTHKGQDAPAKRHIGRKLAMIESYLVSILRSR